MSSDGKTDFAQMSTRQAEAFLVDHQNELEIDGLEPGDITSRVASGTAVVETRKFGVAVLQLKPAPEGAIPHLWVLYIDPGYRNRGLGIRFVREILKKYAMNYHMTLNCYGSRRRAFFGRAGFRIETRDGDCRRMTTNDRESILRTGS
jgi:GNAT superfamily N-acetyltransferase